MKIIAEYPAFIYDGSDIAALVKFLHSPWPLEMDIKEHRVMGSYKVSFAYANNDDRIEVLPGDLIYKGPYGAFVVIKDANLDVFPSLTLDRDG